MGELANLVANDSFYAFSSVNEELLKQTWRHDSLPAIGKWVDTLLESGLVDKKALANVV